MSDQSRFLRSSSIVHYPTCPHKFTLSRLYWDDLPKTDAMREGLLFEFYVQGMKHNTSQTAQEYEKELIGKKRKSTINHIKKLAEITRQNLADENVQTFIEYVIERGDGDPMKCEIDRIGGVYHDGKWIRAIIDLKKTSNIETIWNQKQSRFDFLQAVVYPYCHYKKTGEHLPFVYVITEDSFDVPLIKTIKVTTTLDDFEWLEDIMQTIDDDIFKEPVVSRETCYSFRGFGKCRYFQQCQAAKDFFSRTENINFEELE